LFLFLRNERTGREIMAVSIRDVQKKEGKVSLQVF
jgi:hypothetical protein